MLSFLIVPTVFFSLRNQKLSLNRGLRLGRKPLQRSTEPAKTSFFPGCQWLIVSSARRTLQRLNHMIIIMMIQADHFLQVVHKVLTIMHATDGKVTVFPRCPLELLFQCVTVRSSFTLALVKCGQKNVYMDTAKAEDSSLFAHETERQVPEKWQSSRDEPSID